MSENKLGSYISSFSNKDWVAYNKFSKSLYSDFSDYQTIIKYIRSRKNRYNPTYMDVEYLRKNICPNVKKDTFSKTISNLCKYIEKYLIWSEVENDAMMEDSLLLQALGKRGLAVQFHKQKLRAQEKRNQTPIGLWHHYHEFMGEYLSYYCNMISDIQLNMGVLKSAFAELKNFNAVMSHYLVLEMKNRQVLLKENYQNEIEHFHNKSELNHELTLVIGNLIEMKISKSAKSFEYLLTEVKNEKISKEIRYTILIHLLSYLSYKIIKGNLEVRTQLLGLQKYGLENGVLFPSGRIPLLRFTNILNTACSLKDFIWASEFVENYSHSVTNQNSIESKTIGYAQIEFSKKNFSKTIDLLIETKFKSYEFELKAKWLLLCSNYELNVDNYSIIEYHINGFKYFLKRNEAKATELRYLSFQNCLKYILKIAKEKNIHQTIHDIENEKNLFFRNWIVQKAYEKKTKKR